MIGQCERKSEIGSWLSHLRTVWARRSMWSVVSHHGEREESKERCELHQEKLIQYGLFQLISA